MINKLKKLVKTLFPPKAIYALYLLRKNTECKRTKRLFDSAKPSEIQLNAAEFEQLHNQYNYYPEYGYSPEMTDLRGKERSKQLIETIPSTQNATYLEVGCMDGMVCYHLEKKSNKAIGIDIVDTNFSRQAIKEGLDLRKMDASKLSFEDNYFDVVFSYDAFEHFKNPISVLAEIYRVTKPGGYIYLEFGPLFMSPKGLHAYRETPVPYCQHLFSKETLFTFIYDKTGTRIDFNHCNGWSLMRFRNLFNSYTGKLKKIKYREISDLNHLDIIRKHPSIFKAKTNSFEDLTCNSIEVLFKKDI